MVRKNSTTKKVSMLTVFIHDIHDHVSIGKFDQLKLLGNDNSTNS